MKLRAYLVLHGPPNRKLGMSHPIVKQIAAAAGVTTQQVYKVSLGRAFASERLAKVIATITHGRVPLKETINAKPRRPGRKPDPSSKRQRELRRKRRVRHGSNRA